MTQLAKREQETLPAALTPMDMIDRAVASGANVETLTKLMDLQERYEKNQARKAFDAAIADAKSKIKPVHRNVTGHNNRKYADFAAIASAVDPILSEFGLSYRFRSAQGERINVTCVLSHNLGHSEETTLSGPPDKTGNKNDIQAIGSTLTYLQRYSLMQALGLAASNDTDGNDTDTGERIMPDQIEALRAMITEVGADEAKFLKYLKIEALSDLPVAQWKDAVAALEAKRGRK
jgi:hypothetical protein